MSLRRLTVFTVVFACLAASFSGTAAASGGGASDSYVTTLYNERSGLPTGEANDVLQTADGYIWIGSYGGLIRYDGTTFRNLSLEGLIPSSSVRSLFEDSAGRLWIGTNDAGVFYMEDGAIHAVDGPKDSYLCIRCFAEGADGVIYVASSSGMGEIREGRLFPYTGQYAGGETVYSVGVDAYGRVWGALNSGLCVVVKDGVVLRVYSSSDFLDGEDIYCTAADSEGSVYLGSSGSTLIKLTFNSESLEPSDLNVHRITTGGVSTHNMVKPQKDGSVIVCGGIGSYVIYPDGSHMEISEADRASAVNSGCVDYEGNVWLASTSFGIIKYTRGCFTSPNRAADLDDVPVNAIVRHLGLSYVATDSGLNVYEANWTPVSNALTELYSGVRVRALLADSSGRIWVAAYSYTAPLSCYDTRTRTIRTYTSEDGLISTSTRALLELSGGSIAVGTQEGVNIIRGGEIVESYGIDDGLEVPSVLCLMESADGTLLAGSDGGGIYEIDGGTVKNHGFSEGLDAGVVLRILPDSDGGGYFVSAGSSLYYWDGASFRLISNLTKGAGSIFDLYDRDGSLWILQNNGILAYDKAKLLSGEDIRPTQYSFQHGLTGSLNANTWNWMNADGKLYIATRSGISIFGFDRITNLLPKVIVNSVSVDGEYFENPHELLLSSDAGRITIGFAALTFTGTTEIDIAYCLEGFDRSETVISGSVSESVSYTNLPGGKYVFTLRIFDPDDPSKFLTSSLPIEKEKRLSEQPFFIPAAVLVVAAVTALIVALISRAKIRSMQKRQREYRKLVEQSLKTCAHTIDAKDRYTNGHSLRVAEYSRELARRMGKSEEEQENIYYIALLHDIGKIGVPDNILNKPGRLTDDERQVIQSHPTIGGEILKDFTALDGISDGARYHHERYDGKGYNAGLAGEDIPEVARIIGVADTYDAMSSDRCYRKGLPSDVIIEEFEKFSGAQFDPKVVPYMLDMIKEGVAPIKTGYTL